jgi:hypothetical protein
MAGNDPVAGVGDRLANDRLTIQQRCMTYRDQTILPEPEAGWFNYSFSVLSNGALAVFQTDSDIQQKFRKWFDMSDSGRSARRMPNPWVGNARLCVVLENGDVEFVKVPLVPHPLIDRLPDGQWLFVSSRSARDGSNAIVLAADGSQTQSFHLGDGLSFIRCAPDNTIWGGYFDEGVFGDSIGTGGIVQFDGQGKLLWSLNEQEAEDRLFVSDCYSLTLDGSDAWSCYYADFPIVKIRDAQIRDWPNEICGAKALAVDRSQILLAGGYGEEQNRLALVSLEENQSRLVGCCKMAELSNASLIQGRSSTIHVVHDQTWVRVTLDEARPMIAANYE